MNAIPAQEVAGHCLQAFTQIVPASQAAFYCVDRQLQARDFRLHQMSGEMHRDYLDNYRQFDPLQPRNCQSSGLAVVPLVSPWPDSPAVTVAAIETSCNATVSSTS
jgi:hypothetical protein